LQNLDNVDLTDMIGRDHLWGSANIMRLVRVALGCLWGGGLQERLCPDIDDVLASRGKKLSVECLQRLYRWAVIDADLWNMLGRAMDEDAAAVFALEQLDVWSLKGNRLMALLDAGSVVTALDTSRHGHLSARRSRRVLQGLLRFWLMESPDLSLLSDIPGRVCESLEPALRGS